MRNMMEGLKLVIGGVGVFLLVLVFICLGPWLFFWAIETIFEHSGNPIEIEFNFWTWLAAMVVGTFFNSSFRGGK